MNRFGSKTLFNCFIFFAKISKAKSFEFLGNNKDVRIYKCHDSTPQMFVFCLIYLFCFLFGHFRLNSLDPNKEIQRKREKSNNMQIELRYIEMFIYITLTIFK